LLFITKNAKELQIFAYRMYKITHRTILWLSESDNIFSRYEIFKKFYFYLTFRNEVRHLCWSIVKRIII